MQKGPKSLVTYLLVLLCISYTNTLQWFASESKRTCLTAETWSHVHTPHAREAGIKLALQWTQTCMAMTFIQPWDWILAHGPFLSHWFHFNSILSYQNKELQVSSCFLVHVLFQKISLKKCFNPTHYSNLHHYKILLATFWSIDLPQAIPGEKAICLDMTLEQIRTSSTSSQLYPSPVYPSGHGPHSTPSAVSIHMSLRKHTPGVHFGFTTSVPSSPRINQSYLAFMVWLEAFMIVCNWTLHDCTPASNLLQLWWLWSRDWSICLRRCRGYLWTPKMSCLGFLSGYLHQQTHAYHACLAHHNVLPQAWHSEMVFLRKDVSFTCKHACKHKKIFVNKGWWKLRTLNKRVIVRKALPAE